MALPSQTDRSNELGRGGINPGRSKGPDPVVIALGLLVVAALVFGVIAVARSGKSATTDNTIAKGPEANLLMPPLGDSKNASPGTAAPDTKPATPPNSGAADPKTEPKTEPKVETKPPVVLNQGGQNPATPDTTKPGPVDVTGGNTSATPTPNTPTANPINPNASTMDVLALIESGDREAGKGNPIAARNFYSKAMLDSRITAQDQGLVRDKLTKLNDETVFGSKFVANDPLLEDYKVVSGDRLVKIPAKLQLPITGELIARMNKLTNPNALRIGQTLHVPRGPFHVIVSKSQFRADVFAGSPDEPDQWTFVKSFRVGLGADDGTPVGTFIVRNKMSNPSWVNPRTGQRFDKDDPKNPIGERWVGLEGTGPSANIKGYGLHGTIEPDSIGQQKSMGCVRFGDEDVKWIYDFMVEKISVVQIKP